MPSCWCRRMENGAIRHGTTPMKSSAQACQALPLYFGMAPQEAHGDVADTLNNLSIEGFVSGEIGMHAILQTLQAEGYQSTLFDAAFGDKGNNYASFVENGFTTLDEYWEDNPRSHNHDMMGSLLEWYFNGMTVIQILSLVLQR